MSPRRIILLSTLIIAFVVICSSNGQAQTSQPDRGDFDAAIAMLRDAAVRMDSPGIQFVRDRFTPYLEDETLAAEAHYQMAFADFSSLFTPDMANRTTDPQETMRRLDRAIESLMQSTGLDDSRFETWCLLALAELVNATVVAEDEQQAMTEASDRHLERAVSLDPDHPEVMAAGAMIGLFGGDTDAAARLEEAVEKYRLVMTGDPEIDAGWWPLLARGMLARMDQFRGNNASALELVEECLALEPNYPMAALMKPRIEKIIAAVGDGFDALDQSQLPKASWAVLSEDGPDDGRDSALADGKTLSYWFDTTTNRAWFRFELHQNLNPDAFGVNLIIDADGDQSTGANWWGTNSDFTWDRLVTVWVKKGDNGKYGGTVGVGDMTGLSQGDFISLYQGGVDFAILEDQLAIVIGVPISYLTDGTTINVIGAVGSSQMWNDDLQDEGFSTITLP